MLIEYRENDRKTYNSLKLILQRYNEKYLIKMMCFFFISHQCLFQVGVVTSQYSLIPLSYHSSQK